MLGSWVRAPGGSQKIKQLGKSLTAFFFVKYRGFTLKVKPRVKQDFGEAVMHKETPQHVNYADVPAQSIGDKKTMVAEPF